jgi:hypothetical protein
MAGLCWANGVGAEAPARDDDRRIARDMAKEGISRLNEGRYQEALDLFQRAYQLVPAPTVAVLRGRAFEQLGNLAAAADSYAAATRAPLDQKSPEAFRSAVAEGKTELARLEPQIPRVTVLLSGATPDNPGLEIRLDDHPMASNLVGQTQRVNPGEHRLVVSVGATLQDERRVILAKGQQVKVLLRVGEATVPAAPPPPPPPPPAPPPGPDRLEWVGWGAVGVGAAGFVTGVISGIVMLNDKADLDDQCRPLCPRSIESELRSFRTARTVSAVGYGVGFLGAGVGAAILLTAPARRSESPRVTAVVGPGTVGIDGRF